MTEDKKNESQEEVVVEEGAKEASEDKKEKKSSDAKAMKDRGEKKKESLAKKVASKMRKKSPKEELEEMEGKYLRALADHQNLIKQSAIEKQSFIKYANAQIVMDILPVYDNLKMAVSGVGDSNDAWVVGVKYVVKQFETVLNNSGVKEIEAEGKKFDPAFMEAIEGEGEMVKKVMKPGYVMNDRVLVAVRVIVGDKE